MNPLRQQLLPVHAQGVPGVVAEANTIALEATVAVETAGLAVREAEAEAKAAPGLDAEASAAAVRAGKKQPPPTEASKLEELDAVRRAFEVLKKDAELAVVRRDRAVADNVTDWIPAQHKVVDGVVTEIDVLADQLTDAYRRLEGQAGILDALYVRAEFAERRRSRIPNSPHEGRWIQGSQFGHRTRQRPDGSVEHVGAPVAANPTALVEAVQTVAREMVPERPVEPTPEELRKHQDFEESRKAWAQMAAGGIHVPR